MCLFDHFAWLHKFFQANLMPLTRSESFVPFLLRIATSISHFHENLQAVYSCRSDQIANKTPTLNLCSYSFQDYNFINSDPFLISKYQAHSLNHPIIIQFHKHLLALFYVLFQFERKISRMGIYFAKIVLSSFFNCFLLCNQILQIKYFSYYGFHYLLTFHYDYLN